MTTSINRKPIFDAVRRIMGRGFSSFEVTMLDRAIDEALGVITATGKLTSPAIFFDALKPVTGRLNQTQVDTVNAVLKRMQGMPVQHVAYVLATAWHEARFKPQREWGRGIGKPYGKKGKHGQAQYGRGLVQLTWDHNYEWADKRLGLNGALLRDFDLALRPDIAADILVFGMLEGAFASDGKPLGHYGPNAGGGFDYLHARRTVNVMDKAELIAGVGRTFEKALRKGGWA